MKHIFRRLTALSAAAITLLSVVSIPASAYTVTNSNYTNLTYTYTGAGAYYCWSTAAQQNGMPEFTSAFLNNRNAVTVKIAGQSTMMLGTLNPNVISKSKLQNPAQALQARRQIDKITAKDKYNRYCGLKLYYWPNKLGINEFAFRLLNDYSLRGEIAQNMKLDEFTVDYLTGEYSGRLFFDEFYLAGMRISSNDTFTTFEEPVLTWDEDFECPMVYVDFHGQVPNTSNPIYEGVYDRYYSNREQFEEDRWNFLHYGFLSPTLYKYDLPILTNLTVTYNGCTTPYTTNAYSRVIYYQPVGVHY
ncbi:MAG: hypothetical protein J5722_09495 [Oscillospiraceae bacterium]|nr:hypothetical protein [Oscillospiraceae bacterium]